MQTASRPDSGSRCLGAKPGRTSSRPAILSVACLLCVLAAGCPTRDNPLDPGRCDPRCQSGKVCLEGSCVPPDGGGSPGAGSGIVFSYRSPAAANTHSTSWTEIPGLSGQTVTANGNDRYLVILNVPETHVGNENKIGQFRLLDVDESSTETTLASGAFSAGAGSDVPVTIVAVKQLSAGEHTIKGQWRIDPSNAATSLHLGSTYKTWLVVVRAAEDDLQSASGPSQAQMIAGGPSGKFGVDIDIAPVTTKAAGDYLLILNAPRTSANFNNGPGGWVAFEILVGSSSKVSVAKGSYRNAFANQHVPTTVVGVKSLAAGQQITARWSAHVGTNAALAASPDGVTDATWLVAMRVPQGITHTPGSSDHTTGSSSYQEVDCFKQSPVSGSSAGGNYLFLFNAADSSLSASSSTASFQLLLDKTLLAGASYKADTSNQHTPLTLVGIKDLPAATSYSATVRWGYNGPGGTLKLSKDNYWLLGFTQ